MVNELLKRFYISIEQMFEIFFIPMDRRNIKRSLGIKTIPYRKDRWGGKISYAEWAHVIGLFQGLIFQNLTNRKDPKILDVGCGKGLLGIAALPYLTEGGKYIGLDVMASNIDFGNKYFKRNNMNFVHLKANNPAYSPGYSQTKVKYAFDDNTFELVTALSVWTHLAEEDAKFYFREVSRVLKPGGRFIMTCWYLNNDYNTDLLYRAEKSKFNGGKPKDKIFGEAAYESKNWKTLSWVNPPEQVCGITIEGMDELLKLSGMEIREYYPGNWKEQAGMYYQDIVIFEKP